MQNWDGSGGNGAALRHFEATGSKYPLVVKLGTITPHSADVFSYAPDENDMVEDPKLVSSRCCIRGSSCMSHQAAANGSNTIHCSSKILTYKHVTFCQAGNGSDMMHCSRKL